MPRREEYHQTSEMSIPNGGEPADCQVKKNPELSADSHPEYCLSECSSCVPHRKDSPISYKVQVDVPNTPPCSRHRNVKDQKDEDILWIEIQNREFEVCFYEQVKHPEGSQARSSHPPPRPAGTRRGHPPPAPSRGTPPMACQGA